MRGKPAVILIKEAGFATGDDSLFRGRALTQYGRWTCEFEEAARQGEEGASLAESRDSLACSGDSEFRAIRELSRACGGQSAAR